MKRLLYEIRSVELDLYNWLAQNRHQVVHSLLAPWKTINDTRYRLIQFTIVSNTLIEKQLATILHLSNFSSSWFKLFPEPVIARCFVEWIEIELTAPRWPVYFVKHCPDSFLISFNEKPSHISTNPNLGCFVHWRRCKYSCPCFRRADIKNCILVSNDRWTW